MPNSGSDLYAMALPKSGRPEGKIRHFHHTSAPVFFGTDAIVIDGLSEYNARVSYGRYYGCRNRWFSVYATFDPTDLTLSSSPDDDFPFLFNCDIATPHVVEGNQAYTINLYLDVLVLGDGETYRVKDEDEFEDAYAAEVFGDHWYSSARRELDRLVREMDDGRLMDNVQALAPSPTKVRSDELGTVRLSRPDEVDFKHHSDFPRFQKS